MANTLVRWSRPAVPATPFEPDCLTSHQWAELAKSTQRTGEQRLAAAVLEDAIQVYQKNVYIKSALATRLQRDVVEWFASGDMSHPFTFEWICLVLGLEPEYIRRGLRAWRESGAPAPRKTPSFRAGGHARRVVELRRVSA